MSPRVYHCPSCGRRYTVDLQRFAVSKVVVICGSCEQDFCPDEQAHSESEALAHVAGQLSVLVAHEAPAVTASVGRIVRRAGYTPRFVTQGSQVIAAFDAAMIDRPVALVLDVGIPDPFAFDVVAALRENAQTKKLPIILLASVFDPARYKRRPNSLHGADAYLELHHVPDRLPSLLQTLIGDAPLQKDAATSSPRIHTPEQRADAEAIRQGGRVRGEQAAFVEARRVVSDMALYSEAEFASAAVSGKDSAGFSDILQAGEQTFLQAVKGLSLSQPEQVFARAVDEILDSFRRRGGL